MLTILELQMQRSSKRELGHRETSALINSWRNAKVEGSVFQWQSLCLALTVFLVATSAGLAQTSANGPEIRSGDVWLLPSDRVPSALIVPQVAPSKGDLPTGDVWLVPARSEALATEQSGQQDAALVNTNK